MKQAEEFHRARQWAESTYQDFIKSQKNNDIPESMISWFFMSCMIKHFEIENKSVREMKDIFLLALADYERKRIQNERTN